MIRCMQVARCRWINWCWARGRRSRTHHLKRAEATSLWRLLSTLLPCVVLAHASEARHILQAAAAGAVANAPVIVEGVAPPVVEGSAPPLEVATATEAAPTPLVVTRIEAVEPAPSPAPEPAPEPAPPPAPAVAPAAASVQVATSEYDPPPGNYTTVYTSEDALSIIESKARIAYLRLAASAEPFSFGKAGLPANPQTTTVLDCSYRVLDFTKSADHDALFAPGHVLKLYNAELYSHVIVPSSEQVMLYNTQINLSDVLERSNLKGTRNISRSDGTTELLFANVTLENEPEQRRSLSLYNTTLRFLPAWRIDALGADVEAPAASEAQQLPGSSDGAESPPPQKKRVTLPSWAVGVAVAGATATAALVLSSIIKWRRYDRKVEADAEARAAADIATIAETCRQVVAKAAGGQPPPPAAHATLHTLTSCASSDMLGLHMHSGLDGSFPSSGGSCSSTGSPLADGALFDSATSSKAAKSKASPRPHASPPQPQPPPAPPQQMPKWSPTKLLLSMPLPTVEEGRELCLFDDLPSPYPTGDLPLSNFSNASSSNDLSVTPLEDDHIMLFR